MNDNLKLNISEIEAHKTILESLPYKFYLEITQKCNLRCIMCDHEHFSAENKDFPHDIFQKIKPFLEQAEEVNFYFFGESTLSPQLFTYLEETKDFKFLPKIFTNGTVLNDRILDKFDQRGVFVNISIEATTPKLYEKIRRGASFQLFKKNIERYVEKYNNRSNDRFHLRLSCTSAIDHIPEILNIIEFAKLVGINDLFFGAIDNCVNSNRHLSCDDTKAVYYLKKGKELADKYGIRFACPRKIGNFYIEDNNNWNNFSLPIDKFSNDYLEAYNPNPLTEDCGYPWIQTIVRANGDVCSCCQRRYIMGNLYKNSFEEIWNGKKYQELRAQTNFKYCLGLKCNMVCYSIWPYQISRDNPKKII